MLFYYATRDGQSRRVAERIGARLCEHGIATAPEDLAVAAPTAVNLTGTPLLILVAAIRYGRHLPEANRLLAMYSGLAKRPPLVLVSVNLTARKPGKDTPEGNAYLRKAIARYRLAPVLATAIAGRLDYSLYSWFDRQMIRLIMLLTGGPTDSAAQVEYTDWSSVDAFAARIAGLRRDEFSLARG